MDNVLLENIAGWRP